MKKERLGKMTPSEASMDSIQLVASLLMCYPEMGKVTLDSAEEGVWLDFSLLAEPDAEKMVKTEKLITDSLKLFHELEGISHARLAFFYEKLALHVFRDIESLTRTEIELLVALINDSFGDILVPDAVREMDEETLYTQSEMIDHRIRFLRENHIKENMVGIREDGRVMVY